MDTITAQPSPTVAPVVDALLTAMQEAGLSLRGLEAATAEAGERVPRATINLATRGQRIGLDKARRIAAALGQPVGALFVHANGDPIGEA